MFDTGLPSRTVVAAALAEGRCRPVSRNEIRARSVVGSDFVPLQRERLAPLATLVHSDANVKAVARSITRQQRKHIPYDSDTNVKPVSLPPDTVLRRA